MNKPIHAAVSAIHPDRPLRELFNMEDIQALQDVFALATGVSVQIIKADGSAVTAFPV